MYSVIIYSDSVRITHFFFRLDSFYNFNYFLSSFSNEEQ